MCSWKKRTDCHVKDCMIKYSMKYNQPWQFMEQIIPTMKVRRNEISVGSKYQEIWDSFRSDHRLTDLRKEATNANPLFYIGGSVHRELTVFAHDLKIPGSSSAAIASHFQSRILSISTILPTSPWDIDGENLLLTQNSKLN